MGSSRYFEQAAKFIAPISFSFSLMAVSTEMLAQEPPAEAFTARYEANLPKTSLGGFMAKYKDIEGVRTRYYDEGIGEPLLLVHGGPWEGTSSANDWSRNLEGLSKEFRVLAPDRMGTGMSGNPGRAGEQEFTELGQVKHLANFIKAMNVGPVNIAAHAEGGISLFLALEYPELVKSLVLFSSNTAAPRVGEDSHEEALAECPWEVYGQEIGPWIDEVACRYRSLSYSDSHVTEEFIASLQVMNLDPKVQWTRFYRDGGAGEPFRSNINEWHDSMHARIRDKGELKIPVLLIWAHDDPTYPLERSMALYDVIATHNASVQTLIMNDAGHYAFREKPDEFNYAVIRFIKAWSALGEIG